MISKHIGYKMVREIDGILESVCSPKKILYNVNLWSVPKKSDGPLAVFYSFQEAENFIIRAMSYQPGKILIFKCLYVKDKSHDYVWSKRENCYQYIIDKYNNLPPGTILAKKVKLLERVSSNG